MNLRALIAIILVALISGLTIHQPAERESRDQISALRQWALQQKLWPELDQLTDHTRLIAVRQVYQEVQEGLRLKAFLLTPCRNLCGDGEVCARQCQTLIKEWDGVGGDARILIEAHDLKRDQSLGRITLRTVAPLKLRYWSRKQRLIALTQEVSSDDHRLHILQLVTPREVDALSEMSRAQLTSSKGSDASPTPPQEGEAPDGLQLRYYDSLELGSFSGLSSAQSGATQFIDLDGDQSVELIAPLESLVHLTPIPIAVPTPHRLTSSGLSVDRELIQAEIPRSNELRGWILQRTQTSSASQGVQGPHDTAEVLRGAEPLLIHAARLCLVSRCDRGEELISFAYPQHTVVLRVWRQLRERVSQSAHPERERNGSDDHPFSVLDQRFNIPSSR